MALSPQATLLDRVLLKEETRTTSSGTSLKIRPAVKADKTKLSDLYAPGEKNDEVLENLFNSWLVDFETVVYWAETDGPPPAETLGVIAVTFPTLKEACVHSLRVAPKARKQGLAHELWAAANRLATEVCGPSSCARMVVKSDNEVMVKWCERLEIDGPVKLAQYKKLNPELVDAKKVLPNGWTWRPADEGDIPMLLDHANGTVGEFERFGGDEQGVDWSRHGALSRLDESLLESFIQGRDTFADGPYVVTWHMASLIFDEQEKLVAFSGLVIGNAAHDANIGLSAYCPFISGTRAGLQVMPKVLDTVAAFREAHVCHFSMPDVEWLDKEIIAAGYSREPGQDLVWSWVPADFVIP